MKKLIALFLALTLISGLASPAFAADGPIRVGSLTDPKSSVPVIYISGDSNVLTYDNGTKEFAIEDMLNIFKNSEDGNISEAAFNILYPFILEGIAFNKWDNYYEAVYKELSEVYEPVKLDENGEPKGDCGIPQWQKDDMAAAVAYDRAYPDGTYRERTYRFFYDWRLDPIVLADQLNDYIEGVKRATGHDKVVLSVRCLGCNLVMAYINKYSTDSLKGVGIDVATSMGAEFLSGTLSGDFGIDGNAIARIATDLSEKSDFQTDLVRFAVSTVNLLDNAGVLDAITDVAREQLYSKIEYGIISALALTVFMTYPGYWAMVSADKFDTALNYVFGEEGSEKRQTYKGLIEKAVNYNETIKKNILPIMKTLEDNGVNVCIISKYGVQMVPFLKNSDILGDEYVSANHSSLGATTSTIYTTLSDEYIAAQTEKGLEKYISPDKQVDASTCLFPDYTWFFKGAPHGHYSNAEVAIMMTVMDADKQLTVNDFDLTQFAVYDYKTRTASPMTTENCNNENWEADDKIDHPKTKQEKLFSFLTGLFRWLKNLIILLSNRLGKAA